MFNEKSGGWTPHICVTLTTERKSGRLNAKVDKLGDVLDVGEEAVLLGRPLVPEDRGHVAPTSYALTNK